MYNKNSGSLPRNACVTCKIYLCVTTKKVLLPVRQTHRRIERQTDTGQSDSYVPLCFAGDTKMCQNDCQKTHTNLTLEWLQIQQQLIPVCF